MLYESISINKNANKIFYTPDFKNLKSATDRSNTNLVYSICFGSRGRR